ncbi:AtuA-related protein [Ulvibacterium sp.]|uniref:AtuA-related protein n=1 Tax=Ulvibacterium sp. TaxID=2665914 RepID=UPI003CC640DE
MKLWEIAHSRSGDKGNISNISLIVFNKSDYGLIKEKVTEERVKQWLGNKIKGNVERYELPQLGALNFVLFNALDGGVTSSTSLDKHGKSLSSFFLQMTI